MGIINIKMKQLQQNGEFKVIHPETDIGQITGLQVTKQVEQFGIVAPKTVNIVVEDDGTFRRSPIEVLKFTSEVGDNAAVIKNEAAKFEQNETYIFGNAVQLKTSYTIPAQAVAFVDGYVSESDEFDFKKIEKVEVV